MVYIIQCKVASNPSFMTTCSWKCNLGGKFSYFVDYRLVIFSIERIDAQLITGLIVGVVKPLLEDNVKENIGRLNVGLYRKILYRNFILSLI